MGNKLGWILAGALSLAIGSTPGKSGNADDDYAMASQLWEANEFELESIRRKTISKDYVPPADMLEIFKQIDSLAATAARAARDWKPEQN